MIPADSLVAKPERTYFNCLDILATMVSKFGLGSSSGTANISVFQVRKKRALIAMALRTVIKGASGGDFQVKREGLVNEMIYAMETTEEIRKALCGMT